MVPAEPDVGGQKKGHQTNTKSSKTYNGVGGGGGTVGGGGGIVGGGGEFVGGGGTAEAAKSKLMSELVGPVL